MTVLNVLGKYRLLLPGSSFEEGLELGRGRQVLHCKKRKDLANNCAALETLVKGTFYRSVTDYFAGVGLWASVASGALRSPKLTLFDLDEACVKHLRQTFPGATVEQGDSYRWMKDTAMRGALNLLDITKCTLYTLRKKDWPRYIFDGRGDVLLSDCAGAKLHMNYRSYGLSKPCYDTYLKELVRWASDAYGYRALGAAKCGAKRFDSGYVLLSQKGELDFPITQIQGAVIEELP